MNNEEKILALLEKHGEMLEAMQAAQEEMRSDISGMQAAQEEMRSDISDMQTTLTRVAVTQEGVILPKLQLLYEGQAHLQDTLAPKERVEVLEEEMITLKSAVKMMMKRLEALEKAQ